MSQPEFVSTDPCTGQELWRGVPDDAGGAVDKARAAAAGWAARTLDERVGFLKRFQAVVREHAEPFAKLIARETGKPFWETKTEVASVAAKIDISIAAYHERTPGRATEGDGFHQRLAHKPHGVLAVLGPCNFPAHLPNGHIVPALLAGNTVVFKPSEQTPAVGACMADCWAAAGLPEGVFNLVQGGGDTGRALAMHPGVDGLLFTGSAPTGAALARQFADTPWKMLALELGGNNPLIAWDVAARDLDAAAAIAVQSAYLSAGQRCTCARRLIVGPDGDTLIDRVAALIDRVIVGNPFADPAPFMGPVIDNAAADRLIDGFAALVAGGGRVVRPLARLEPGLPFLSPALIDVTGVADRPDTELFGPILQIVRVADFEAALAEANATRFGLAAGLIGGDFDLYGRFWAASRAGIVNWNRPTNGAASNAPFGGIGASGNHRPSAWYAADYCAWPVASMESESPDVTIATGLR